MCGTAPSVITDLAFPTADSYPQTLKGALLFTDYNRECIWAMPAGPDGSPDPTATSMFMRFVENPVDLEIGPEGNLYYVDFDGGTVRRIVFTGVEEE
jgi:hypothetical protein